MNQKDFLIPGAVIALVLLVGGILLVRSYNSANAPAETATLAATSTATTTAPDANGQAQPGSPARPASYYPYGAVTLGLDQAAGFRDGLSIRPLRVLEDSRCPADANCIQAGTVSVSLRVSTASGIRVETIALGESLSIAGNRITLSSVAPQRKVSGSPTDGAYRFTFAVVRGAGSASSAPAAAPCYVGGCSAQLCSDQPDLASTCEYRAEYGCYQANSRCERQATGRCGWTQTAALTSCLANPPQ